MVPIAIVLTGLSITSLLIGGALTIAWARFGRERHAALWAAGFYAAGVGHAAQIVKLVWPSFAIVARMTATDCLTVNMALLALGFRYRAGLYRHGGWIVAATIACAVVAAAIAVWDPKGYLSQVEANLFACVMMILSALAVRNGDVADGARMSSANAHWLLFAVAGYCGALMVVALAIRPDGPVTVDLYRFLVIAGVPTIMTGIGLGGLLLLGGDVAERLHRLAEIDPLTGVLNRRGIERAANRAIAQARRCGWPLALAIADLDRFKAINDSHGHALGDQALTRFAALATAQLRGGDLFGRLGGEEFVFILADCGVGKAAGAMDRVRHGLSAAVADLPVAIELTASFGIATLGDRTDTLDALIARADEALYRSKDSGRDRVSFAAPQSATADPRFRTAWLREPGTGATGPRKVRDRVA